MTSAADRGVEEITAKLGKSGGAWLPLESNPTIFDAFGKRIGLPEDWGFVDILGFDAELLDMVPKPCAAVILLFPCSAGIYRYRREEEDRVRSQGQHVNDDVYFLSQHSESGNSCGTVAAIHAIVNSRQTFELKAGGPLDRLMGKGANMSPDERGRVLLSMHDLRERSDTAAEDASAQTRCPPRDGPDLEHHFAAFVRSPAGRLVELDGTKPWPVDHGEVSQEDFVRTVGEVITANFVGKDESASIEFSAMALARRGAPPPAE